MNPGRRKRLLIAIGAVVVVAFVGVAVWPGPKEPEYQGKKLSEWVDLYITSDRTIAAQGTEHGLYGKPAPAPVLYENRAHAEEAVSHIGAQAVPWLLKWLNHQQPTWRRKVFRYYVKLPFKLRLQVESHFYGQNPVDYCERAARGFAIIRSNAAAGVPALVESLDVRTGDIIGDSSHPDVVVICLGSIGRPARAALPSLERYAARCFFPSTAVTMQAIKAIRDGAPFQMRHAE
jgi:hypothetical protein